MVDDDVDDDGDDDNKRSLPFSVSFPLLFSSLDNEIRAMRQIVFFSVVEFVEKNPNVSSNN